MDWEPAESKNNNDHQDHFNNPLFVSNTLCGGMTTWGLGPQSAQHNGVHTADQQQWEHVARNKEGNLEETISWNQNSLESLDFKVVLKLGYLSRAAEL